MTCVLCKTSPSSKCAFDNHGKFTPNNWNCVTMNRIRQAMDSIDMVIKDDLEYGSIGTLPVACEGYTGAIVAMWYKDRGRTEKAVFIPVCTDDYDDDYLPDEMKTNATPLTEQIATKTLSFYKTKLSCR